MNKFNLIPLLLPLTACYAELHYHLPWLFPAYYRRQPEIIADLPHRLDLSQNHTLPLLIIIKDAQLFPVTLKKINIILNNNKNQHYQQEFELNQAVSSKWFSQILEVDIRDFTPDSWLFARVEIYISQKGKDKTILNDNFPGLSKNGFKIWLAQQGLNLPHKWLPGDLHYHSHYTSDQVEFGADPASTARMAQALGLKWFCLTDHSYDLDDSLDDYTKNDPDLPKWKALQQDINNLADHMIKIIPGEEVSIGNSKKQNVHLLALNEPRFIEGHGDSAEVWGKNQPQHLLTEVPEWHSDDNLFVAAHPFDKVSLAQKLTLRRGNWQNLDFQSSSINHLQAINTNDTREIARNINIWKSYLLKGNKFFLLAGNDAHGNFNIMRQIKLPFLTLWETHSQIFGRWMSLVQASPQNLLHNIKKGRISISNGPFLCFELLELDNKWLQGDTCPLKHATVKYQKRTTPEFGEIETVFCYRGDINSGQEFKFPIACPVNIALPKNGYIRLSLITTKGFQAFTNPIFTSHKK